MHSIMYRIIYLRLMFSLFFATAPMIAPNTVTAAKAPTAPPAIYPTSEVEAGTESDALGEAN